MNVYIYIPYTRILVYYNSVCFIQYDLALNILKVLPWNRWDPLYAWCPSPSGDRLDPNTVSSKSSIAI